MTDFTHKPAKVTASIEELNQNTTEQQQINQALANLSCDIDLEGTARYSGAIQRKRVIRSAEHLLRFVLTYALMDLPLSMVGLWGTIKEWGSLSKAGIYKRLCGCDAWLGCLIALVLRRQQVALPQKEGYSVCLSDASSISYPGSQKIDFRLHLCFNLTFGRMSNILLTDVKQGESLTNFSFSPKEIILADRAYGVPRSLGVILGAGALFAIRIGWQNLPLKDAEGHPFSLPGWLRVQSTDPAATPAQLMLYVTTPQGRFPVRVVARAIPPESANEKRKKLLIEAKKKKRCLNPHTTLAAGYVMVVTNLPVETWTAAEVLDLYRFRWQIELIFKSLKSLLHFDHLRAKDPRLAKVYLLSKLLIALLITEGEWCLALAAPETFHNPNRLASRWRVTEMMLEAFRQAVCGSLTMSEISQHLSQLGRYLCDEPRNRPRQLAKLWNMDQLYGGPFSC